MQQTTMWQRRLNQYKAMYHAKHAVKLPVVEVVFQEHVKMFLHIMWPDSPMHIHTHLYISCQCWVNHFLNVTC